MQNKFVLNTKMQSYSDESIHFMQIYIITKDQHRRMFIVLLLIEVVEEVRRNFVIVMVHVEMASNVVGSGSDAWKR